MAAFASAILTLIIAVFGIIASVYGMVLFVQGAKELKTRNGFLKMLAGATLVVVCWPFGTVLLGIVSAYLVIHALGSAMLEQTWIEDARRRYRFIEGEAVVV